MASGMTEAAARISTAVRPVLAALGRGTPHITADDLDDLMSQVVEKVLRRLDFGADIRDLEVYSKRVARTTFYDRVRRRGPIVLLEPGHVQSGSDPWLEQFVPLVKDISVSDQFIAGEDALRYREMIIWAFGQLTVAERTVLLLRHGENRTSAEVAEKMGYKSAAVVDTMAARARRKLESNLSPSLLARTRGQKRPGPR